MLYKRMKLEQVSPLLFFPSSPLRLPLTTWSWLEAGLFQGNAMAAFQRQLSECARHGSETMAAITQTTRVSGLHSPAL